MAEKKRKMTDIEKEIAKGQRETEKEWARYDKIIQTPLKSYQNKRGSYTDRELGQLRINAADEAQEKRRKKRKR